MDEKNKEALLQEPIETEATPGVAESQKYHGTFPTVVDFLVFFGIFLLSQGIGAVVGWIVAGWPDMAALESTDEAVRGAAEIAISHFNAASYFIAMTLTLAGFLFYRFRRRGPHLVARVSLRGLNPMLLLWGVVFIFASSLVLEPVMSLLPDVPNAYGRGPWALLTLVVMAPLFEEVIFRGVILESARAKYGVMVAWLVSSLIFGLVHMHPAIVLNAFVIGLILAFVYIQSGSLWPAVILHAINNGIAYLMLVTGHANTLLIDLVGNRTVYLVLYAVGLGVFVISGYMVYRTLARIKEVEKNPTEA